MTTWRAHLAVMLAKGAVPRGDGCASPFGTNGAIGMGADGLNGPDTKASPAPIGTNGTIGSGAAGDIAFYLRAVAAAREALAAGYGDGEHDQAERGAMAAHYAAEPLEACP